MIGPRVGLRVGPRAGIAVGIRRDELAPFPLAVDGGKAFPLTQAQVNAWLDESGVARKTVAHSHAMQDASGAAAVATIGTNYVITGTVDYQQALPGLTRRSLEITATAAERIAHAAGVGLSPAAGSVMRWCVVDQPSAPGANSTLWALSLNAANFSVIGLTTSLLRLGVNAVNVDGIVNHVTPGPYIACSVYDKAVGLAAVYTSLEKVVGTYSAAVADGVKGYGTTATPAPLKVGWDVEFGGANAEWGASRVAIETAVKKAMLTLGWPVPWTPS